MTKFNDTIKNYQASESYYNSCYQNHYMDSWPKWKINRVKTLISGYNFPLKGKALDFGCGSGVWTRALKEALPLWDIYGTDISATALQKAEEKTPDCKFLSIEELHRFKNQFNLIFTHHVLEHLFPIREYLLKFSSLCVETEKAYMVHILPCGNQGSYESNICSLILEGIEKNNGNRFFFEDEGNVQRFTTDQIDVLMAEQEFFLTKEFYANQLIGAWKWIIAGGVDFVKSMYRVDQAINDDAKKILSREKRKMIPLSLIGGVLPSPFSHANYPIRVLFHFLLLRLVLNEWNISNQNPNGSEMYLFFERECIIK